jgi:hypothetical protein
MKPAAEIHDLGYTRYTGERVPPRQRYRVIARNLVGVAWRSRWVAKLAVIASVGITLAAGVAMYVLRSTLFETVRARGADIPRAEQIIFAADQFYELAAFILAVVWGCAAVANDLRLGAFQFYFARALRPRDYVAGKLLGLALLIGIPMFAGPVALALIRLFLADGAAQALQLAPVVLRAVGLGLAGTAAYVLPVAGIGALTRKRQTAQALFAIYWLLICPAAFALSWPLRLSWIRLISMPSCLSVVGHWLFDVAPDAYSPPVWAAAVALVVACGAGLALVARRVSDAAYRGLGGSS